MERPMEEFYDPVHNVASIGPFQRFPLTVNGWTVPNIQAKVRSDTDGRVSFTLDNRLGIDVPAAIAGALAAWIADVVAVSMGYACHPREGFQPGEQRPDPVAPARLPWRHMVGALPGDIEGLREEASDG